jgi:hypothetical protein
MALFVLTINNLSPALDRKNSEVERIQRYAERAIQAVRGAGGAATSGNVLDDGGATVVGSWTYTAQAST